MLENFFLVRRFGEFAGQVLSGKMQPLMHVQPPLRAVGHIIYDALMGDEFTRAALAGVALQLGKRNNAVWDVHRLGFYRRNACIEHHQNR